MAANTAAIRIAPTRAAVHPTTGMPESVPTVAAAASKGAAHVHQGARADGAAIWMSCDCDRFGNAQRSCHHRACPGDPDRKGCASPSGMAGSSPAMTRRFMPHLHHDWVKAPDTSKASYRAMG